MIDSSPGSRLYGNEQRKLVIKTTFFELFDETGFLDDGENSENIISSEPPLQKFSNLYGSLHWWQSQAWKQKYF